MFLTLRLCTWFNQPVHQEKMLCIVRFCKPKKLCISTYGLGPTVLCETAKKNPPILLSLKLFDLGNAFILWTKKHGNYIFITKDEKHCPAEMMTHFEDRFGALDGWYRKHQLRAHYCMKPIFHKSFDIDVTAWTPIQSRDPVIERYNLKYHGWWSRCMASGSWYAPLVQVS